MKTFKHPLRWVIPERANFVLQILHLLFSQKYKVKVRVRCRVVALNYLISTKKLPKIFKSKNVIILNLYFWSYNILKYIWKIGLLRGSFFIYGLNTLYGSTMSQFFYYTYTNRKFVFLKEMTSLKFWNIYGRV